MNNASLALTVLHAVEGRETTLLSNIDFLAAVCADLILDIPDPRYQELQKHS